MLGAFRGSTVRVVVDAGDGKPRPIPDTPWYPGITALQAMIVAQAQYTTAFNFRVVYHSEYGAFVDELDDVPQGGGKFWFLSINGQSAPVGVSESVLFVPAGTNVATVAWKLEVPSAEHASAQVARATGLS